MYILPSSIISGKHRILRRWWYSALLRHLRNDLARYDRGFLCDFLVGDGVALAPVMVRVAAGGDEEGEVNESVDAEESQPEVIVFLNLE